MAAHEWRTSSLSGIISQYDRNGAGDCFVGIIRVLPLQIRRFNGLGKEGASESPGWHLRHGDRNGLVLVVGCAECEGVTFIYGVPIDGSW